MGNLDERQLAEVAQVHADGASSADTIREEPFKELDQKHSCFIWLDEWRTAADIRALMNEAIERAFPGHKYSFGLGMCQSKSRLNEGKWACACVIELPPLISADIQRKFAALRQQP